MRWGSRPKRAEFGNGRNIMKLILASSSQRRRELLTMCGYDYSIEVSLADENTDEKDPVRYVSLLAERKAREVYDRLGLRDAAVLGADTVVYFDGSIIGKPRDEADAKRILALLSGNTHTVYTGVAVVSERSCEVCCDTARVTFAELSEDEIDAYIASGEPMDKAGAYGLQGPFGMFVKEICGNCFTVIGLPLPTAYRLLKNAGVLPRNFENIGGSAHNMQ